MSTVIKQAVPEGSSAPITVNFYDNKTDLNAKIPDSIKWSLVDRTGAIVNSREDVVVSVPAAEITIVLSGADLIMADVNDTLRYLLVESVIDLTAANDLPAVEEFEITIRNLRGVPYS